MTTVRRIRRPVFSLCHPQGGHVGVGHTKTPWVCRTCGGQACSNCAHRFGWNRTPVSLTKEHERIFTCSKCSRDSKNVAAEEARAKGTMTDEEVRETMKKAHEVFDAAEKLVGDHFLPRLRAAIAAGDRDAAVAVVRAMPDSVNRVFAWDMLREAGWKLSG